MSIWDDIKAIATGRKKVFISFAIEDARYRGLLVGQARNAKTPFEFIDMSVKRPFDEKWKTNCRERIGECHGFIALLSKKTWRADGARWEMKCAREKGMKILGVHIHKDEKGAIPPELSGKRVINWTWKGISNFLSCL